MYFCTSVVSIFVFIYLSYLLIIGIFTGFEPDSMAIDNCLDLGGAWNYEKSICIKAS